MPAYEEPPAMPGGIYLFATVEFNGEEIPEVLFYRGGDEEWTTSVRLPER